MSERIQRTRARTSRRADEAPRAALRPDTDAIDALLDEIDDVLETDAQEYVKSFVQKGGQ